MPFYWKMNTTFPFTRVCILGIILFFFGLASMIISIIAFITQSWGHYVGTGMWGGALILASGLTAVFVSRLKSLASVRTFLICSVVGMFASLTMLILSAGGLTLSSGFYGRIDSSEYNKRTSNLVHASLLVISVFCLSGNVLAVIVSSKYLFFDSTEKSSHRRRPVDRNLLHGTVRTSLRGGATNTSSGNRSTHVRTSQRANETSCHRHSANLENHRVPIEYRRTHRRSASENPQSRRHRGHQHEQMTSVTCNPLSFSSRLQNERRLRCSGEDRLNRGHTRHGIGREGPHPSHGQVRLSRIPGSGSPNVRLPTEFNEEELPPYEEAVRSIYDVSDIVGSSSPGDSGEESDTENSSSTDAHSYDASVVIAEGVEMFPMVDLRNQYVNCKEGDSNHQKQVVEETTCLKTLETHGAHVHPLPGGASQPHKDNGVSLQGTTFNKIGAMIMRQDSKQPDKLLLRYVNTCTPSHTGEYERLLSVSPEVCAITGASPEPEHDVEATTLKQHIFNENFYENGPCYENIKLSDVMHNTDITPTHNSLTADKATSPASNIVSKRTEKKQRNTLAASARKVPIHVLAPSSMNTSTSPTGADLSSRRSIGSPNSAFRPVKGVITTSVISTHNAHSSAAKNPIITNANKNKSSLVAGSSAHLPSHTIADEVKGDQKRRYKEQGAIPKHFRKKESVKTSNENANLSWKNIQLPHSYNHSETLSNDLAGKLPSKRIPFTNSKLISANIAVGDSPTQVKEKGKINTGSQQNTTNSVSQPLNSQPTLALNTSSGSGVSESVQPVAARNVELEIQSNRASASSPAVKNSSKSSQCGKSINSAQSSRWLSRRMGGNQCLLQTRREELRNASPAHHHRPSVLENRPLSVPSSLRPLTNSYHTRPSTSACEQAVRSDNQSSRSPIHISPLSLNSYLVNHSRNNGSPQPPQLQAARSNQLVQQYPLQPQQPRLGVQLHQRRQQQHQLQQNIESQQQQQQQQQPLPLQVHQQNPAQQQRNGRPLFSVLL